MEPAAHSQVTAQRAPAEPAALSPEEEFRAQVDRDLPRNFTAHLIHGLLGQTGFKLIQAPTFLPAYIDLLSGSSTIVGSTRACQAFGCS